MNDECKLCRESRASGQHGLSPEDAAKYPEELCPKCSGVGVVRCVTATRYHFHCACSVWWSEPITLP